MLNTQNTVDFQQTVAFAEQLEEFNAMLCEMREPLHLTSGDIATSKIASQWIQSALDECDAAQRALQVAQAKLADAQRRVEALTAASERTEAPLTLHKQNVTFVNKIKSSFWSQFFTLAPSNEGSSSPFFYLVNPNGESVEQDRNSESKKDGMRFPWNSLRANIAR